MKRSSRRRPTVQPIIIAGYGFLSGAMVVAGIIFANDYPLAGGAVWFAGCLLLCYAVSLKVHHVTN